MAQGTTTISVSHDTWEALNQRKNHGDTFEDVIRRMMDQEEA